MRHVVLADLLLPSFSLSASVCVRVLAFYLSLSTSPLSHSHVYCCPFYSLLRSRFLSLALLADCGMQMQEGVLVRERAGEVFTDSDECAREGSGEMVRISFEIVNDVEG